MNETAPATDAGEGSRGRRHRRSRRSRHSGEPSWDRRDAHRAGRTDDKRQMLGWLVGGVMLFALLVAGVVVALNRGGTQTAGSPPPVAGIAPKGPPSSPATSTGTSARSDLPSQAAFLTEAEDLARRFLAADRIETLLPLVRDPERAEPRMRVMYPDGVVKPAGMLAFDTDSTVVKVGKVSAVKVRTGAHEERGMAFVPTPGGLKVDWESWVLWDDMPWGDFLQTRPATPVVFRLFLKKVEYYNFDFKDERKWQSYRLTSADGKHGVYGYAERGSPLNSRIASFVETPEMMVMLAVSFPADAASNSQVVIERFVADGWVENTGEETP